MKYSHKTIGLFQAAGIILYVSFFASVIQMFSQSPLKNVELGPFLAIIIFLLAFIVSAVICGSIFLAYPLTLFFDNKKKEAYRIVVWSLGWLIFFFLIVLIIVLLLISNF
ncbi:MAG TPA: hypothetical protein VFA52_01955 [Candidatus Paceibacterota bacterium]|nr:hypothetical protein [Candidatus Paceibacterota bacterium]